jgi:gliding motility-associated-like protein
MNVLLFVLLLTFSLGASAQVNFSLKISNTNCVPNGGSAKVLLPSGVPQQNVLIVWSNGKTTDSIGGLSAGNYAVTVYNSDKSDSAAKTFSINNSATLSVQVSPYDTICTGTTAILRVFAEPQGGNFIWTGGDLSAPRNQDTIHVQPKTEQIYQVTYQHPTCPGNTSVKIVSSPVKAQIVGISPPTCGLANGAINGAGSGFKANFFWLKDGQLLPTSASILNNLKAGIYTFIVYDAVTGCSDTVKNIVLTDNTTYATITAIETTPDSCLMGQGTALIKVSGGSGNYTFRWSHNNAITGNAATKLAKGSYRVTVNDGVCTPFDTTIQINGPDTLISLSTAFSNDNCSSGSGSASAIAQNGSPPYSYTWNTGATGNSVSGLLGNKEYTVTVVDQLGCTANAKVWVGDVPAPTLKFLPFDSLCPNATNGSLQLQASGGQPPYRYQWLHDSALTLPFANQLPPGVYKATVTDAGNCTATADITIAAFQNPSIDVGEDKTILKGTVAELNIQTSLPVTSVKWFPFIQSAENRLQAFVKPDTTTTFFIEVSYGRKGCIIKDTITVFVVNEAATIEVPNIFTPNEDDINDYFYIQSTAIKNFNIKIFDRWGNKVFESFDAEFRWSGKNDSNGADLPQGVFTYLIEYTELNTDKKRLLKGSISLLR